jgi:hypothetical protein
MSFLPFFQWCEASRLGTAIRSSSFAFPIIESIHLLALALIAGAVLMVDLRLLGFGLRHQPLPKLARDAQPWLVASLLVLVSTGILLFLSESIKCYYSTPFRVKMTCLLLSIVFAFTVRRRIVMVEEGRVAPVWRKLVAVVSLTLWFGVAASGRWIGFSG